MLGIAKVGDTTVRSSREITAALHDYRAKRTFTVTIVRNKREMPVSVTLEDQTGRNGAWEDEDDFVG